MYVPSLCIRVAPSVADALLVAPTTTHMIQKFNSTSSLYIKDTLQAPDLDEITWWYAYALPFAVIRSPDIC